jgi:hypothetical protein
MRLAASLARAFPALCVKSTPNRRTARVPGPAMSAHSNASEMFCRASSPHFYRPGDGRGRLNRDSHSGIYPITVGRPGGSAWADGAG